MAAVGLRGSCRSTRRVGRVPVAPVARRQRQTVPWHYWKVDLLIGKEGPGKAISVQPLEYALEPDRYWASEWTGTGFQRMGSMPRYRSHSIEFKRQVAQEFIAGESLHALAKRHDISRNLIRVWVAKFERGAFDEDALAADLIEEYEAKIAALERMVGRQALEIEFLKGTIKNAPRPRGAAAPATAETAAPSRKDAD